MSRNNSAVLEAIKKLKQTASRELETDDYKRFVRKADAVVRELNARPRNNKRANKAVADLINEVLKRNVSADE